MLKFILGRATSGKTYTILSKISESVKCGKEPILIVPEQFSFESEKAILDILGDKDSSAVSVLPFTRLYETIGRLKGGIAGKTVSGADKLILMNRAIAQVSGELKLWGKYAYSGVFAESMIKVIDEFKYNAVSSEDLLNSVPENANKRLALKIYDTALIMDSYKMLLGTNFIDPSDYMDKLYYMLENCEFFSGKDVFFDGFKSFSGQQFKIIDRIVSKADNVTFSFLDDPTDNRELSLIGNIRDIENKIKAIAKSHNKKIEEPLFLNQNHYKSDDLFDFERCMFTGKFDSKTEMKNVTVCKAQTVFDETEFVARNIRRIVREKGAKFSDFVVMARNTDIYENALSTACIRNKVKCFIDKKLPLASFPVSASILSAISFTQNKTTANIFKFHKSGIGILSVDEISELENYVYIWNISGKDFDKTWDMNPLGFTERVEDDLEEKLSRINSLRQKAIEPLNTFKENFCKTPKNRVTAIINLLHNTCAKEAFLNLYDEYKADGKEEYANSLVKSYTDFLSILDSIITCFPDTEINDKVFFDALSNSVNAAYIGVAPQTLDEVVFGQSDRIRPAKPKYAFIMGANQGIFPMTAVPTGLFTNMEFAVLKDMGLNIPDRTQTMAIDEELLVYSNSCCASNEVYLSYFETSSDGSGANPSAFIEAICDNLNVNKVCEPQPLSDNNLPETLDSAMLEYCKRHNDDSSDNMTLREILKDTEKSNTIKIVDGDITADNARLNKDIAKELYGNSIYMSPTKFDNYSRCKFMFFCKNALKASRLYPADFNVMQRGTLIHFVLQRIIELYGKSVCELSDEEISKNVDNLCEEYLERIVGFRSTENTRTKYLVSNMARSLKYVVKRISLEFAQSDFEPKKCEVKIGNDGEIPEIKIDLNEGNKLRLSGVIDRLDTYNGYVRIVDYKSGSRSFRLPDILVGQNMQMLLYLYAVIKSGIYGDKTAGILYMNAKRVKDGSPADRRMNGLIVANSEVVLAMDKENKGEFIPRFKEDNPSDSYLYEQEYNKVFEFLDRKLKCVGNDIFEGKIEAKPIDGIDSPACKYCDFKSVCRITEDKITKVAKLSNCEVMEKIEKGEEENGNI